MTGADSIEWAWRPTRAGSGVAGGGGGGALGLRRLVGAAAHGLRVGGGAHVLELEKVLAEGVVVGGGDGGGAERAGQGN